MNELFDCIRQLASKELPSEEIKAFRSPYDAAAKLAFSRKAVLGLLVKHGLMSAGEVESAETDFLENEFPSLFICGSGAVSSGRLVSDRIVRVRCEGRPSVFLVLEIQSRPDGNMLVRMRRYLHALFDQLMDNRLDDADRHFCLCGMVVNISLDNWGSPVTLTEYCGRKNLTLKPTLSVPDFGYLSESAERVTGTEEGRRAYMSLPEEYRELEDYHGRLKRYMERRTLLYENWRPGKYWGLLFCLVTKQEPGVIIEMLRKAEEEEGMEMDEILRNFTQSAREEGHAEGLAEGMREGRSEGRSEGMAAGKLKGAMAFLDRGIEKGLFEDYQSGLEYFGISADEYPGLV